MIVNWLKTICKQKKSLPVKNETEQHITDLMNFLWNEIDIPANAYHLKSKRKSFNRLSIQKKIDAFPELYLLLEEHLLEKNILQKYSKQHLRNQVTTTFQFLLDYPTIELIFRELKEQEIKLCSLFLSQILNNASKLLGEFNDPEIIKIQKELTITDYTQHINVIKERKKLLESSSFIFSKIKDSLGENTIINIYLVTYKKHFQSYHLLESFTSTLNVIPEEIFARELINFPSKQQMLKMLQKQLYSLEEVNERFTEEIIERKKIQNELKHSEDLKSRILETAMDGIILVDKNGIVLDWNKKAENILRISKEETIGTSIYPLLPHKLRREIRNSIKEYIETGIGLLINKRVESSVYLKDSTIVHVELTIIAIKANNDYLFNAFFRDITNRIKVDNEIREAKIFAEKSAKAKSTFLSNMSHEIRTPLNVILGLTGILQKSNFSDPIADKKNLDGIQFSAENLLVLINDILDFSKIEAGKLSLHKTDFNIHELIKNVSRGFRIKADEKGLTYHLMIDQSLPTFIIGDQFRLNQILTNLIGNAIKFTHKGGVRINIQTKIKDIDTITIDFSIADTGVGIPKSKLTNIFQSFYQVHEPGKHKIEGTGLGLSISKQLIELQGGTLTAESIPEKGSNFKFSIVYKKSKLTASKTNINKSIQLKNTSTLSGMHVLVVEDNRMNQFFIKQLFTNWNIEADIAENGKIALEKLQKSKYDLILMDMHMPVMDGSETAIHIRASKNPKINNIPIIACSADVFPESKKTAIESGMNFYLTKPISEKALEEIIFSLQTETETNKKTNHHLTIDSNQLSTVTTEKTHCNFSGLQQTFGNDTTVIQSILQLFLEEAPIDYQKLQSVIKQNHIIEIKQYAHKLKSSFKTLGLEQQSIILQQIELKAKEDTNHQQLMTLFDTLNASFPKIVQEIKQEITNLDT